MADKKSFIVYYDKREMLEELLKTDSESSVSYERVGRLFMALFDFAHPASKPRQMQMASSKESRFLFFIKNTPNLFIKNSI